MFPYIVLGMDISISLKQHISEINTKLGKKLQSYKFDMNYLEAAIHRCL